MSDSWHTFECSECGEVEDIEVCPDHVTEYKCERCGQTMELIDE